jgi:hypothetical protein
MAEYMLTLVLQGETMPDVSSIDIQHEIQWYMRPYLLDFLVEAHSAFQLLPETLYLTINLLDRYCSRRVVYKRHYQLVGCAALLIAAKYGDKKDRVPTFRELRSMCCQLYEEEMFMQMEWHVLQTLDYVLGHPTVDSFLQIALAESAQDDSELLHMTWYLSEIALYHKDFVAVRPSVLARSALALARCIIGRQPIPSDTWSGRFDPNVILCLVNCLQEPSRVLARKYSSQKLSTAAQSVEYFVQSQQNQQSLENSMQIDTTPDSGYATPSTPHKHTYAAPVMQHGCMTPPITPESDTANSNVCPNYGVAPQYPATPSPVPSNHSDSDSGSVDHHQSYNPFYQPRPE